MFKLPLNNIKNGKIFKKERKKPEIKFQFLNKCPYYEKKD